MGENLLILGFGTGGTEMRTALTRGTRKTLSPGFLTGCFCILVLNTIDAILDLNIVDVNKLRPVFKTAELLPLP